MGPRRGPEAKTRSPQPSLEVPRQGKPLSPGLGALGVQTSLMVHL